MVFMVLYAICLLQNYTCITYYNFFYCYYKCINQNKHLNLQTENIFSQQLFVEGQVCRRELKIMNLNYHVINKQYEIAFVFLGQS